MGRYHDGMPTALIVLVYALAVARVTRLINADRITQRPRMWLENVLWFRWERSLGNVGALIEPEDRPHIDPPLGVYLLTCPWCVSIYVGAVAAPIAYWWGAEPWLLVPALALAFSQVTGLMAKNGE